ncbi:Type 1 glutamine amidotransferase-like domain-containing protein [Hwangdonia sp.]|uniref:Type 1 glutamine amidotransferase-like domain-containing protein n=1 Tax=Hwangdonia sp. TaxID=1883432 RepID=UPI003AB58458
MKYYLSSYKFGNSVDSLKQMLPQGARIAHINNARDSKTVSTENRNSQLKEEMEFLDSLGFVSEHLNLRDYFGRESRLRHKMVSLDGVWVCGGNAFILRQAMKLSGFDNVFQELLLNNDYFYGGYSAGVCILSDSLKYIQFVDNPNDFPYTEIKETIWEGLNLFNYGILPHYRSNHPESTKIERAVKRCIDNKWPFITLKDAEVLTIE